MLGVTSPWIIKSVRLAVAAKRLRIEVECPHQHWADPVVGLAWTDRENFARFRGCRTESEGRQFFDRWEADVFKRKKGRS